jgi:hypothetical protein
VSAQKCGEFRLAESELRNEKDKNSSFLFPQVNFSVQSEIFLNFFPEIFCVSLFEEKNMGDIFKKNFLFFLSFLLSEKEKKEEKIFLIFFSFQEKSSRNEKNIKERFLTEFSRSGS